MIRKIFGIFLLGVTLATGLTSCVDEEFEELGDTGQTFIKILDEREKNIYFSPFEDVRKVDLFSVRRDANSEGSLRQNNTITLTAAPELIEAYNEENETNYVWLDEDVFTWADNSSIQQTSNGWNLNFGPGEFAKELAINLNGSAWDPSVTYAVAYKITDADGLPISSGRDEIIALISIKNQWDAIYRVTGEFSDVTNAAWSGLYDDPLDYGVDVEYSLQTLSETEVLVISSVYGGVPATPFYTGTSWSYFGSFGLILEFDPETNKIVKATNYYGQPSANGRSALLDPDYDNRYDPETQTIFIKFHMTQPSVVPAAPHIRATWTEEWSYIGER